MDDNEIKKEVIKLKLFSLGTCLGILIISVVLFRAAINQSSFIVPLADELSVKVITIMAAFCLSLSFLVKYENAGMPGLENFKRTYKNRIYAKSMAFAFGLLSYFLSNDLSILLTLALLTIVLILIDFPTRKKALKFAAV